jgi:hypothetical protein
MQSNSGGLRSFESQQCSISAKPYLGSRCAHLHGRQRRNRPFRSQEAIWCTASVLNRQLRLRAAQHWPSATGRKPFLTGYVQLLCHAASQSFSPTSKGHLASSCMHCKAGFTIACRSSSLGFTGLEGRRVQRLVPHGIPDPLIPLGLDFLTFLAATVLVIPVFKSVKASPVLGFLFSGLVLGQLGCVLFEVPSLKIVHVYQA